MWELYDELIAGIPEDLTVEKVICGMVWTAVKSSAGGIGLAMTTNTHTLPPSFRGFAHMPLKTAAERVKSWNFIEAGIGMAAINAYYNSVERLEALKSRQENSRFCTFDIPFEGKNVAMVGALRYPSGMFDCAKRLTIMERSPVNGTYPDSACEYYLPDSDLVLITGSAFINKTMPRLLQLAQSADIIITGPSTPMAPCLLKRGVRRLAGLVITDEVPCFNFVAEGHNAPPYGFGERYYLE